MSTTTCPPDFFDCQHCQQPDSPPKPLTLINMAATELPDTMTGVLGFKSASRFLSTKPLRRPPRTRPLEEIREEELDREDIEQIRKEIAVHGTIPWEQIKEEMGLE